MNAIQPLTTLLLLATLCGGGRAGAQTADTAAMNQDVSAASSFEYEVLAPSNRPYLTCSFLRPAGFRMADLPPDELDIDDPKSFAALGIAISEVGPAVISIAARPAYGDGAVSQWLDFLCREEGYERGAIRTFETTTLSGVLCDAIQKGDGIEMRMRLALLEDGGRMFQISTMAPVSLWGSFEATFDHTLQSFGLLDCQGQQTALFPPDESPAQPTEASAATGAAPQEADEAVAEAVSVSDEAAKSPDTAKLNDAEWAELVLADDDASLDPEHPMNANLRDNGVGLTPRVHKIDTASKSAYIGLGAIQSIVRIPLGWHAFDDGRRALIFDAAGRMQINLDIRHLEGDDLSTFTVASFGPLVSQQPNIEVVTMAMDGIAGAMVRDADFDGETLCQAILAFPSPADGYAIVARITASADDFRLAMNLGGDILARLPESALLAR